MNKPSFLTWRPMTTVILLVGLAALLIYSVVVYVVANFKPTVEWRMGSGVYHLWVADDDAELAQGLSGVTALNQNGGLLMNFGNDHEWGIWMKDMEVPLDIIWLDKEKKAIYIVKNAGPELSTNKVFTPKTDARYVIELPAGSVEKAGIRTGMVAEFDEADKGGLW